MQRDTVTGGFRDLWPLTAHEAAHALPVLQSMHSALVELPAPRLPMIRHVAQRAGITDGALRTALSRACSAGSLQLHQGRYRLGPTSVEQASAAKALLARVPGYTLGVVLEGGHTDLRDLRALFARLGFRPMQRSVWVGARTVEDRLTAALQNVGVAGSVVVFHCDEVDARARTRLATLWGLADREAELRLFHQRLFEYVAAPRLDRREAALRCVEAAPVWYRVAVLSEPPFPIDLCGSNYPSEHLNAQWREHLASMADDLRDLWTHDER